MTVLGLCGGSGSGKGAVSAFLIELGIPSIDTDKIYHELVSGPSACLAELVFFFGKEIIKDGALDRQALGDIVFPDLEKRALLNTVAHRHVLERVRWILSGLEREGKEIAAVDAPLLFESGFDSECDYTACVVAERETRIKRIMKRDGISRERAEMRISSQLDDSIIREKCDFVINNDGDFEALKRETLHVIEKIRKTETDK